MIEWLETWQGFGDWHPYWDVLLVVTTGSIGTWVVLAISDYRHHKRSERKLRQTIAERYRTNHGPH